MEGRAPFAGGTWRSDNFLTARFLTTGLIARPDRGNDAKKSGADICPTENCDGLFWHRKYSYPPRLLASEKIWVVESVW
jgi:hypothetical protein